MFEFLGFTDTLTVNAANNETVIVIIIMSA